MTGKTAGQATIGAAYATEENDTMDKAMVAAGTLQLWEEVPAKAKE